MQKARTKVFVAMSGGVDSSVSAALLKEAGYEVTGVFMHVWQPDFLECTQSDDRREAMRAAAHLGIPFLTFDFEEEYKKDVADYMVREYREGRTPNPDVMCNSRIKFRAFLDKSLSMGADYVATGHYVRLTRKSQITSNKSQTNSKFKIQNSKFQLLRAEDENKDQSYFLWTLAQEQLRHTLFPIGGYAKPKVREMARRFGLPNAERKDSQGLCFVGEVDMREFLAHFIPRKEGDVLNEVGEAIGVHEGAFFYTIGQRHGFEVTRKGPNDPPFYVVSKDIARNTLTVAPRKSEHTSTETGVCKVEVKDVNFIQGEIPELHRAYEARVRYRQPLQACRIEKAADKSNTERTHDVADTDSHVRRHDAGNLLIYFNEPQLVAPGQSLVLYEGEVCLGGGIIQ